MRFASLGSGSRGNATLVEAGSTLVMVDCGFSCIETERRMARLGCTPDQLSAILVTHEHGDHVRGVAPLARKYRLPVWLTNGTRMVLQDNNLPEVHHFNGHTDFQVGDLQIHPFTVPHDAREPCQFRLSDGRLRFGLLTDYAFTRVKEFVTTDQLQQVHPVNRDVSPVMLVVKQRAAPMTVHGALHLLPVMRMATSLLSSGKETGVLRGENLFCPKSEYALFQRHQE